MGKITNFPSAQTAEISPPCALGKHHDLTKFSCGKPPLDDWLRQRALKAEGATARTYVVCQGNTVVAYYSLATGSIQRERALKKLQRNAPDDIPVTILARLAVDSRYTGQAIGSHLLKEAIERTLQVAEIVGVRAMLVHAIDEDAAEFYKKYKFVEFPDGSQTLFLPIATIVKAL
jgi:GNAT superfamily N-acetyltransferase